MMQIATISPAAGYTQVYRGVDIDSDHRLVILSTRLKLWRKANRRP